MAIPASQIVSVPPRVISAGGTDLEITGLILTENPLCLYPGTMAFTSKAAVGDYFGLDSKEYLAAVKYFLGYDNSFRKPRRLHFARLVKAAIPGSLIGGQAEGLEALKAITEVKIKIDGAEVTASELSLGGKNTQSEIAEALTEKIGTSASGATVTYNGVLNCFIVTSGTTGAASSVEYVKSDGADKLGLDAGNASAGSDALTPEQNMDSIIDKETNWVSFTTLAEAEDEQALGFAKWANDQNVEYLYCGWTTKPEDAQISNKGNLPNKLAETKPEGVILTFGDLDHAVLVMAIAASIDWDRTNGLVTFAFKSQSGLAASVTDETSASNLLEMNANFYGRYATRNDDFIFYYQGKMAGGQFGFVDAFLGNLWLRNALQVAIMEGLNQTGRTPYTEEGYTLIRAWCSDPINRGLVNGAIEPGVELSEAQKAELFTEIGEDVSSKIFTDGFYLLVADPGAIARAGRETPLCGLWYTYGGSVHKVNLPVTAVL